MLTITPTANYQTSATVDLEVFAVIGGEKVYLPQDAKYVMQDKRGIWFFCNRKPRTSEGDWTVNKTSIACLTARGYVRALKTDTSVPWLDTCQRTVRVVTNPSQRVVGEDEITR